MAEVALQTPYVTHVANGVTTLFSYAFEVPTAADMQVFANGALVPTSDYTLNGVGVQAGGNVTFDVAPVNGTIVLLSREIALERTTGYQTLGDFRAIVVDADFNRLWMALQQQLAALGGAIRAAYPEQLVALPPAATRANMVPAFDSLGQLTVTAPVSGSATDVLTQLANGADAAKGAALVALSESLTYPSTSVGGFVRRLNPLRKYGALTNDGSTDDAATFQTAAASGDRFIDARGLNCKIAGQIDIPSGQTWLLDGTTLTIASSTLSVFSAQNVDNWALVGPFRIVGDGSTIGTAKGVSVAGGHNWRVVDYTAESIKGWGFYLVPGSSSTRSNHGYVGNFRAITCYKGWEDTPGTGAEYSTLNSPYIRACTDGLITSAGNLLVFGGQIVECTNDGVVLNNGTNHGHGAFIGTNINHHTRYAIYAKQVTNGQDFVGCHIYANNNSGQGAIFLDRSKGVTFTGGHLDCWVYNDKDGSSGFNYFRGMYCPGSYGAITLSVGPNPGADQCVFIDCLGPGEYVSGITINDPAPVYALVERAAGSTQSITAATPTDLVFNTEVFDRRLAYNNATGIFTVPANQAGTYRVTGNVMVVGVGLTTTTFLELMVNAASRNLIAPSFYQAARCTFDFSFDMYLNAADAVKVQATIGGASITHGGTTWKSQMAFERVA